MTAKTMTGARTRIAVLGFQEFMNRVDADRLKRMPPDTFEKFLPFAMALGVEHHWAQAFAGIIQNPPNWYASPNGGMFNPIFFSSSHAFAWRTICTRSSSPLRAPVPPVQAAAAVEVAEDFPAVALAVAAAAPSKRKDVPKLCDFCVLRAGSFPQWAAGESCTSFLLLSSVPYSL